MLHAVSWPELSLCLCRTRVLRLVCFWFVGFQVYIFGSFQVILGKMNDQSVVDVRAVYTHYQTTAPALQATTD